MATVATREAYFETGLDVLSDLGYGGFKLAEVCRRLGVTTGSFYHYFENWSAYTHALIEHWLAESTQERVNQLRADPDPRRRIDAIIDVGLKLPHGAEAAIRVWSAIDPQVRAVQEEVDRQRFEVLCDSAMEILHDERQAQLFAELGDLSAGRLRTVHAAARYRRPGLDSRPDARCDGLGPFSSVPPDDLR